MYSWAYFWHLAFFCTNTINLEFVLTISILSARYWIVFPGKRDQVSRINEKICFSFTLHFCALRNVFQRKKFSWRQFYHVYRCIFVYFKRLLIFKFEFEWMCNRKWINVNILNIKFQIFPTFQKYSLSSVFCCQFYDIKQQNICLILKLSKIRLLFTFSSGSLAHFYIFSYGEKFT